MMLAFFLAFMTLPLASAAPEPADADTARMAPNPFAHDMNVYRERLGCVPIPRQVTGEDRRYDGTRLDRQPPGRLLLAVHRNVDGCPEAVPLSEERERERARR